MKSAITISFVLALMGYAAVATSLPNRVYRQGYKPRPEPFMLHEKGASNGVIR